MERINYRVTSCRKKTNQSGRMLGFIFLAALIVPAFYFSSGMLKQEVPVKITVDAKSCVIIDLWDGTMLYSKNPDYKLPAASTVKVMTAVVALEHLKPSDRITISRRAWAVEPTKAGLIAGVSYTVEDLLKALLVKSANDAAVALAERTAGSEEQFVGLMNRKANELGMVNTHFVNASGLPAKASMAGRHFTTAEDLALLMRYAYARSFIRHAMALDTVTISGSDGKYITLTTHNKLLLREEEPPIGKTGYTRRSRRCFVGVDSIDKARIAFAMLGSDHLWADVRTLRDSGLELVEQKHRRWAIRLKKLWQRY